MTDDETVHIEGYALTHSLTRDGESVSRAELQRAVAARSTVPVRVGDRIIGEAHLSVDDTGLLAKMALEPLGWRQVGVDEGIPYGDRVHDTWVPKALRLGLAEMSVSPGIADVTIQAVPTEEDVTRSDT